MKVDKDLDVYYFTALEGNVTGRLGVLKRLHTTSYTKDMRGWWGCHAPLLNPQRTARVSSTPPTTGTQARFSTHPTALQVFYIPICPETGYIGFCVSFGGGNAYVPFCFVQGLMSMHYVGQPFVRGNGALVPTPLYHKNTQKYDTKVVSVGQ